MYAEARSLIPRSLRPWVLHFETAVDDAVRKFASSLPEGARVLDAGAGECTHAPFFSRQRYIGVDLGVGDASWNYGRLACLADLVRLPFAPGSLDAALSIVTLEHVAEPAAALTEVARVLRPGAPLLVIVPHEWEVHQAPHDFYRYTRFGMRYLLERAGFERLEIRPVGGYFRLLARRLLNGLQFFPGLWFWPAAILLGAPALVLPLFDSLDRDRNFTLGYVCTGFKRPS